MLKCEIKMKETINLVDYLKTTNNHVLSPKSFILTSPPIQNKELNLINRFAVFVEDHNRQNNYKFYIPNENEETKKEKPVIEIFTKSTYDNYGMFPYFAFLADFPYYNHFEDKAWFGHIVGNFENSEKNFEKLKKAYISLTDIAPDVVLLSNNKKIWEVGECVLFKNQRWINMKERFKTYLNTF